MSKGNPKLEDLFEEFDITRWSDPVWGPEQIANFKTKLLEWSRQEAVSKLAEMRDEWDKWTDDTKEVLLADVVNHFNLVISELQSPKEKTNKR